MRMGVTDQLMSQVRQVAPQDTTILLSGETGTGKTRLARLIHQLSPRSSEPFLVINCGSLSPKAIESETFGQIRGSFNGFEPERVGKFKEVGRRDSVPQRDRHLADVDPVQAPPSRGRSTLRASWLQQVRARPRPD